MQRRHPHSTIVCNFSREDMRIDYLLDILVLIEYRILIMFIYVHNKNHILFFRISKVPAQPNTGATLLISQRTEPKAAISPL